MKTNSIPRKKTAPMQPVLAGTKLANARIIIDRRGRVNNYIGHPIMAIDADGTVYEFQSPLRYNASAGFPPEPYRER